MAAALSGGPAAVVSHRSAAVLWGLLRSIDGPVDISVPGTGGRRGRAGVRLHRSRTLAAASVTRRRGIPVTTVRCTIEGLRRQLPERLVRRAIRQAEILRLIDGKAGAGRSRSDLEDDFLRLCRRHRFPPPEVNVRIGRWTVDFLWRRARLVVETDSYAYHRGLVAFQDDRARDLDLRRRDIDVMRVSERQLNEEPAAVAEAVKRALERSAAS
jgi:very-short-patch-repair endonuclease